MKIKHKLPAGLLAVTIGLAGLTPALALTASTTNLAEIKELNGFVRNSWVQGGLKPNGTFGAEVSTPAGFNKSAAHDYLGLIEDPDENGFETTVNGDFFMPGDPYEAWGIKVGENAAKWNSDDSTAIAGSWTSSSTTGDASVTWVADSATDGINVTQVVSAPRSGEHLLKVQVTLSNTTGAEQTVFYSRQVDPDNNKDSEGDYETFNRVVAQSETSQIVTGTAYAPFSTIGYRAADANAVVRISDWSDPLISTLEDDEGNNLQYSLAEMNAAFASIREEYKVGYQDYLDSTIDIVFKKVIPAGGSATVNFDYILSPGEVGLPEYALDLALELEVGGTYSEASTDLAGGGLKPESEYTLTEFSEPNVIFTGTTLPNGNFYESTSLPTDCRPGSHTLILSGISPSGSSVSDMVTYTVNESCVVTAFDAYAGAANLASPSTPVVDTEAAPPLAETGVDAFAAGVMLLASLSLIGFGVARTVSGRNKKV